MQELYKDEYATLTREPGFVRLRRMSVPMPSESAANIVDDIIAQFRIFVPLRERRGMGLLMDMRDAPIMLQEDSRESTRRMMDEITREFVRISILVRTAVGKLQAMRTLREEANAWPVAPRVFDDEQAAIQFLRSEDPIIPPPRSSRSF